MATEKNITMKQFNGTDYDTLYPKTIASQILDVYSKTDTITTETLSQLGLSADKLPNDAFQQIKTLIDNAQASADGKAKIQTSSYVGTSTYGANNPCSLMFDFEPSFLIISGYEDKATTAFFVYGFNYFTVIHPGSTQATIASWATSITNWENNTVRWYRSDSARYQLNSAKNYYYVAIG